MNAWAVIQGLLVAAIGYWTYYWTTCLGSPVTLPWWTVILYVSIPPLLMPLIVAAFVASGLQLRRPSWRRNPFVGSDVLQNTHAAAYCGLACGIVWLFYTIASPERPSFTRAPLPVALFAAGIGCLVSVHLCIVLFRKHLKT